MKKWILSILIVILVIVVAYVAAAFFIGRVAEKQLDRFVKQTNTQSHNVKIEILNYQRGWFTSFARVQINYVLPKAFVGIKGDRDQKKVLDVVMNQEIEHGPILFTDNNGKKSIELGVALVKGRVDQDNIKAKLNALYKFDGSSVIELNAPNFAFKNDELSYTAKNVNIVVKADGELDHVKGLMEIDDIAVKTKEFNQKLSGIRYEFNLHKANDDLMIGERKSTIATFNMDIKGKTVLALDGINLTYNNVIDNNKGKYHLIVDIKAIEHDGQKIGPNSLDITVSSIDIPALLELRTQMSEMRGDSAKPNALQWMKYNRLFAVLISKGLNIEINDLKVNTPWGTPDIKAKIDFAPQATPANNVFGLIKDLSASVDAQLPHKFLQEVMKTYYKMSGQHHQSKADVKSGEQKPALTDQQLNDNANQTIQNWVKEKILIQSGDSYTVKLQYGKSGLLINGNPLPKPQPQQKPENGNTPQPAAPISQPEKQ